MTFQVSTDIGAGNFQPVIPSLESFILYYKFDLGAATVNFNHYCSAYLSIDSTAVTQGNNANTALLPWPGAHGVQRDIRIDQINNNGPTGNWIDWKSDQFFYYRVKCGHSHVTLHATGNNLGGRLLPIHTQAGANWNVNAFQAPTQIQGGAPYMPQNVKIGAVQLPVHTTFCTDITEAKFAGYIGQFRPNTGFDLILASSAGAIPFPAVNLNIPNIPVYNVGQDGVSGCALVVAGSFKKQLGLVSKRYFELLALPNLAAFSPLVIDLVSNMDIVPMGQNKVVGLTAETCDELVLPQDGNSDDPVEIILFS
jgi:hypothetical protein